MKFDKETAIVLGICALLIMGWSFLYPRYFAPKAPPPAAQGAEPGQPAQEAPAQQAQTPPGSAQKETPSAAPAAALAAPKESLAERLPAIKLSSSMAEFEIDPNAGALSSVTLKDYKTSDKSSDVVLGSGVEPETLSIGGLDGWSLVKAAASKSEDGLSATVSREFKLGDSKLLVKQEFKVESPYALSCRCLFENLGSSALKLPSLSFWAGGMPPLRQLAGDNLYNDPHKIDYCLSANKHVRSINPDMEDEAKFKAEQTQNPLDWIGVSNKYFAMLLIAAEPFDGGGVFNRRQLESVTAKGGKYFLPSAGGVCKDVSLQPGAEHSFLLTCYAGPKAMGQLKILPESVMGILHLSYWSWFEFIARPLLRLLNWLKGLCGSYGLSIILLTIIVRLAFWPATQKANKSMRKMQKLQPLVQQLKDKYKDDAQTMNMKMMELYKQEKVNPLGGCLPILLQLPVFFALYSTLDASVELRQVPFLWAHDLSRPDLVGPVIAFGVGLHPLILIMTALMVVQQKMTPSMGDPMQQKIMMLMPLIMLVMLYNLPSGLTLYWTVSQIFSILQLKYTQYAAKREEEKEALKAKTA